MSISQPYSAWLLKVNKEVINKWTVMHWQYKSPERDNVKVEQLNSVSITKLWPNCGLLVCMRSVRISTADICNFLFSLDLNLQSFLSRSLSNDNLGSKMTTFSLVSWISELVRGHNSSNESWHYWIQVTLQTKFWY